MDDLESAALMWLFSFGDQERGVGWNPAASPDEQWKLGRTRALLDVAGAPDRQFPTVLVAGTKGKGSTSAALASMLGAAGYRVGLATKPHLQSYRERIRVDGEAIGPANLYAQVERGMQLVQGLRSAHPDAGEPTTFEITTVLALDWFARQRCDVVVLEVGLGGRLDATNAAEPVLSAITRVDLDHVEILGRTLGAIAREKAGIMRPGRPVVVGRQRYAAETALRSAAREVGAIWRTAPPLARGDSVGEMRLRDGSVVRPRLSGGYQRENLGVAVAAAGGIAEARLSVSVEAQRRGLERLAWPGRFEIVEGPVKFVLDGAHNPVAARALRAALDDELPRLPIHLVLAANYDKDVYRMMRALVPVASTKLTRARGPRAADPQNLLRVVPRQGTGTVAVYPNADDALRAAQDRACADGGIVCVTGSLALVGHARNWLGLGLPEKLWETCARTGSPLSDDGERGP